MKAVAAVIAGWSVCVATSAFGLPNRMDRECDMAPSPVSIEALSSARLEASSNVQAHFAAADSNGDGYISRAEADRRLTLFAAETRARRSPAQAEDVVKGAMFSPLFDRLDSDRDGRLSRAEANAATGSRVVMRVRDRPRPRLL